MFFNNTYYQFKPLIPRRLQIGLRRMLIKRKRRKFSDIWPIDEKCNKPPKGWSGWPEQKKFALVLTHDVDTLRGHDRCRKLVKLEKELGFRSSFYFVPERYRVSDELRRHLVNSGFEVGVHGLLHDGKLYKSKKIFDKRVPKINHYLKKWGAVGFRSPSMHKKLKWIHEFNVTYDSSTFDTDPFEPHFDGVQTIFPFQVSSGVREQDYIEIPYTLPQDFTLFVLMKEETISIWKKKMDWIVERGGMALLDTHPDYMSFRDSKSRIDEYPVGKYIEILRYIKERYKDQYWHVLPCEMASFYNNWLSLKIKDNMKVPL